MAEYRGCELPEDLWYDLDYLWVRPNPDGTFTLGLTDPAQTMAGRVVVGFRCQSGRTAALLGPVAFGTYRPLAVVRISLRSRCPARVFNR